MAMELCASPAIFDLPVFSTVLARTPQLRPKHALPLRRTLASRSARGLHLRYRHFAISLPRAAASNDSNGSSPLITEERDAVTVLEDSSSSSSVAVDDFPAETPSSDEISTSEVSKEESVADAPAVTVEDSSSASSVSVVDFPAENLSSDEIGTSEVSKEESVADAPAVTVEDSPSASSDTVEDSPSASSDTVDDSSSAYKVEYNEVASFEEPKAALVDDAQEQAFEVLKDLNLESVDKYSLALYGGGAFFGLWLISAIVGAVDSIPLVPKLLEVVGLGYTVWFTARFLLFKESREELAAKFDEVKEQVIGSD